MRLLPSSLLLVACSSTPRTREAPACHAESKIVLGGQDDVAAAAGCLTIESLTIRTGASLDLTPLKKLHVILGDLRIGPSVALDDVRLPELHSAQSIEIVSNGDLHGVFLPKLVTAGRIRIDGNIALTTILMPKLTKVAGDVIVTASGELGLVELSSLATIGGELRVGDNPKLTLLELAKLESAKAVVIENNPTLATDIVDALRTKAAPPTDPR